MTELTFDQADAVSGAFIPVLIAGIGAAASIIGNSGAIREFFDGVFDGWGGLR